MHPKSSCHTHSRDSCDLCNTVPAAADLIMSSAIRLISDITANILHSKSRCSFYSLVLIILFCCPDLHLCVCNMGCSIDLLWEWAACFSRPLRCSKSWYLPKWSCMWHLLQHHLHRCYQWQSWRLHRHSNCDGRDYRRLSWLFRAWFWSLRNCIHSDFLWVRWAYQHQLQPVTF